MTSTSDYLRRATVGRVYFHRVTIVVPPHWDAVSCRGTLPPSSFTSRGAVNEAAIRIGPDHPIFGHYPWTQQSRGCGLPGDFISVGYNYILQFNDTENGIVGSSASSSSSINEPDNDYNHYSYDGNNAMGHRRRSSIPAGTLILFDNDIIHFFKK